MTTTLLLDCTWPSRHNLVHSKWSQCNECSPLLSAGCWSWRHRSCQPKHEHTAVAEAALQETLFCIGLLALAGSGPWGALLQSIHPGERSPAGHWQFAECGVWEKVHEVGSTDKTTRQGIFSTTIVSNTYAVCICTPVQLTGICMMSSCS